jgi:hypothetical protein
MKNRRFRLTWLAVPGLAVALLVGLLLTSPAFANPPWASSDSGLMQQPQQSQIRQRLIQEISIVSSSAAIVALDQLGIRSSISATEPDRLVAEVSEDQAGILNATGVAYQRLRSYVLLEAIASSAPDLNAIAFGENNTDATMTCQGNPGGVAQTTVLISSASPQARVTATDLMVRFGGNGIGFTWWWLTASTSPDIRTCGYNSDNGPGCSGGGNWQNGLNIYDGLPVNGTYGWGVVLRRRHEIHRLLRHPPLLQ